MPLGQHFCQNVWQIVEMPNEVEKSIFGKSEVLGVICTVTLSVDIFMIFLSLSFYVKSILENVEVLKLQFGHFWGSEFR